MLEGRRHRHARVQALSLGPPLGLLASVAVSVLGSDRLDSPQSAKPASAVERQTLELLRPPPRPCGVRSGLRVCTQRAVPPPRDGPSRSLLPATARAKGLARASPLVRTDMAAMHFTVVAVNATPV